MKLHLSRPTLCMVLLAPLLALAHTGEGAPHTHNGFLTGLLHPLTGVDHLTAMLALGMWSSLAVRPAWLAPLAFVLTLAAGGLASMTGLMVPAVEPMIAVSLMVLGLLLATRWQLPLFPAALLAAFFAFFHGMAHGAELAITSPWMTLIGMVTSTALLHLTGMAIGQHMLRTQRALGAATGAAVALLGSTLLLGLA